MDANATNNPEVADLLSKYPGGRFVGLVYTKKGRTAGRGAAKKAYGRDRVHYTLITGFSYEKLCARSVEALRGLDLSRVEAETGAPLWALQEASTELLESLALSAKGENESTTDHVYEPLDLEGERVPGARVYVGCCGTSEHKCRCRNCTGDERAPLPGTVYLQGLKVRATVLEADPNGPGPAVKSADKTIAKNALRNRLPIGRYVSFTLEPGEDWILRLGF